MISFTRYRTLLFLILAALAAGGEDAPDAKKLKNPVPFTRQSASRGRTNFVRNCAGCHGNDAKALMDAGGEATDLTSPKVYKHGFSEGEMFTTIRDGGNGMPSFKDQLKTNDIWDLVNFIRSLWPEDVRPPFEEK